MVRHIVSWNFKPELSEEERRAAAETLVARMTALRDLVPCVERLEVFQPPIGLSNCDLCMYTEIDKEENLVVYRDHPEHQKVVKLIHQCAVTGGAPTCPCDGKKRGRRRA